MSSTGGASPPLFPDNEKFDGTNWIAWSKNILIAARMREASNYLNGTVKQPTSTTTHLTTVTIPAFTTAGTPLPAPTTTISVTPEANTKWQSLTPSEDEWESRDN